MATRTDGTDVADGAAGQESPVWYFVERGQTVGPISQDELARNVSSGRLGPDTMVWKDGMPDWRPFVDVGVGVLKATSARRAAVVQPGSPTNSPTSAGSPDMAACVECGGLFPRSRLLRTFDGLLCERCHPSTQPEFRPVTSQAPKIVAIDYAGFWQRFGAWLLDAILLNLTTSILLRPLSRGLELSYKALGPAQKNDMGLVMDLFVGFLARYTLLALALSLVYQTLFLGKFGATPGRMALSIKVVNPDESPITYLRAACRTLASWVTSFTLLIGYLMAAFDLQGRTLHDRLAQTRVIRSEFRGGDDGA